MSDTELRIARFHFPVTALGPGRRFGVWVQGCGLACPGCMSRDTWDRLGGRAVRVARLAALWRRAVAEGADGLTISGGEPLDQADAVTALLRRVRTDSTRDVLVYTGYDMSQARTRGDGVLALADAVITGRYEITQPTRLIWRGSANQRLTPLTELGRKRYGPYAGHEPGEPPLQIGFDSAGLWLIGVPRTGDLRRVEHRLRDRGIELSGVSWRAAHARRPAGEESSDG